MTKSTRHKRSRKEELKKIKLKVGKKLKKPQNETKTDFKARKIVMREQLSIKPQSSLITKKHLNVNELLSRLSHHSVYVRQDGLNGLKELVLKNTKHDLGPYLSILFRGLNPCILDTDHLIRTTAVKVVEAIIMKIGNMIQPYFGLLASHLSCAMVHLNTGVQSDSLQLMDVLLSHATSLIAQSANTILQNFFLLISRKIDDKQNSNTIGSFTLISNPSSRLASIKWRIKLLRSLSRYLEAILGERSKLEAGVPVSSWQVITVGCLPPLVEEESGRTSVHGTKLLTEQREARSFIVALFPLLFQTWSEVGHHRARKKLECGTPLDVVAIELLRYISEIIIHLWNITELVTRTNPLDCKWFMDTLQKHVESDILEGFPYCALEGSHNASAESKSTAKHDVQAECQRLNINLASLSFLYLNHNQELKKKVAVYYIDLFSRGTRTFEPKLNNAASTASSLLKSESGVPPRMCEDLLKASLKCYKNHPDKSRNILLKLPLQASEYTCRYLWKSEALRKWMSVVIQSAVENIREAPILELMLQFKLRNTPGFVQLLSEKKDLLREKLLMEEKSRSCDEESKMAVII